jgi:hypothetical protein
VADIEALTAQIESRLPLNHRILAIDAMRDRNRNLVAWTAIAGDPREHVPAYTGEGPTVEEALTALLSHLPLDSGPTMTE